MATFQEASAHLDQFVEQVMRRHQTPGLAVALTDRERLLGISTHGFADIAARTPVSPDTLFEIGSIGKSFTAVALLQLHEEGRLDLHAPVTTYLPWFRVRSAYEPITVHHLLSHTAGIISGTDAAPDAPYEVWALRETVASAPPGEHFHYSNVGYKVLGLILQALENQPYEAVVKARILDPLGMAATVPAITHQTRAALAVGYRPCYDDRPAHPPAITHQTRAALAVGYRPCYDDRPAHRDHPLVPATWLETNTGDGCIASTAADMAAYMRMLLNRGQGPHGRILSDQSFALLTQPVIEESEGWFYGYGLLSGEVDGFAYLGHGGDMVGYASSMRMDMDNGFGVIALMSEPLAPGIPRCALALLRAVRHNQDLPPLPQLPDPTAIEDAAGYEGSYRAGDKRFALAAEGQRLIMRYGDARIILDLRDGDSFYVDHPDFARFLLIFGREDGQVVEAFHGPDWYTNERYTGPTSFEYPREWEAYPGHYRSHNPWRTNFRIVLRKGALVLIEPPGDEEPLVPLEDGSFRVGEAAHTPERIRFDTIVDGEALRANASGCDFYRFFTP